MMYKNILKISFFAVVGLVLCAACNTPASPIVAAPVVGADQDTHGCKGSAGYQWSALRKECIRLFETGIRLNPSAGQDATLSAFAVFVEGEVELFLPGQPSILLQKAPDNGAGTWKSDTLTLAQWKGMLTLEGQSGTVLYQGALAN